MSSLVRRLQIRILKRKGYTRQVHRVHMSETTGIPTLIRLKRGEGEIIAPDGTSTNSRNWPRHV